LCQSNFQETGGLFYPYKPPVFPYFPALYRLSHTSVFLDKSRHFRSAFLTPFLRFLTCFSEIKNTLFASFRPLEFIPKIHFFILPKPSFFDENVPDSIFPAASC